MCGVTTTETTGPVDVGGLDDGDVAVVSPGVFVVPAVAVTAGAGLVIVESSPHATATTEANANKRVVVRAMKRSCMIPPALFRV
jgi:hypothetical protein